jgi:hypothetical protein
MARGRLARLLTPRYITHVSKLATRLAVTSLTDDAPQVWRDLPGGKGLEAIVPLTWTGVREYPQIQIEGHAARVLRRPEQVFAPAHLKTLHRLPATHDHPAVRGQHVRVTQDNFRVYQVGQTGDTLDRVEVDGYAVPTARATVADKATCDSIRAGNTQTSLGFTAIVAPPPAAEEQRDGSGMWAGPHGPEPYDLEHLLDPEDPRVIAYAAEDADFDPADLGGNHLAVAIPRGRGGAQSELLTIVDACDALVGSVRRAWTLTDETQKTPMANETVNPTKVVHCVDIAPPKGSKLPQFTCDMDPELAAKVKAYIMAALQMLESAMTEKAEVEVKLDAAMGAQEAATGAKTEAETKLAEATDELGKVKAECDSLRGEVKPLREKALSDARELAIKLGAPKAEVDSATDLPAVQAAWAKVKAPKSHAQGPAAISGAWAYATDSLPASVPTPAGNPGPSDAFKTAAHTGTDSAGQPTGKMAAALGKINRNEPAAAQGSN